MKMKKKFLHCTTLLLLSLFFTSSAAALSITNLDDVPHNVTLIVAGQERMISLMPYQRWQSNAYPIKVRYNHYITPALERASNYAIWKNGKVMLQFKRNMLHDK